MPCTTGSKALLDPDAGTTTPRATSFIVHPGSPPKEQAASVADTKEFAFVVTDVSCL